MNRHPISPPNVLFIAAFSPDGYERYLADGFRYNGCKTIAVGPRLNAGYPPHEIPPVYTLDLFDDVLEGPKPTEVDWNLKQIVRSVRDRGFDPELIVYSPWGKDPQDSIAESPRVLTIDFSRLEPACDPYVHTWTNLKKRDYVWYFPYAEVKTSDAFAEIASKFNPAIRRSAKSISSHVQNLNLAEFCLVHEGDDRTAYEAISCGCLPIFLSDRDETLEESWVFATKETLCKSDPTSLFLQPAQALFAEVRINHTYWHRARQILTDRMFDTGFPRTW